LKSIYICYDEMDREYAQQIKKMFERENVECQDLSKADIHLLIFTKHASKSFKVMDELHKMISFDKKILTLKYTNEAPSDELSFYISTTQWMDMSEKTSMSRLLDKILRQIR